MKKLNKIIFTICLMSLISLYAFAESDGEKAFKNNNPSLAAVLLEEEIKAGTASATAYNYLGLSYYQLGDYGKSVEAFAKGLSVSGTNKKILAYNQGNSYYAMQDFENAAKAYSLTLTADPKYTKALLNRANAYLMAKDYNNAILDYEKFIIMEPQDEQRPQIEELLALCDVIECIVCANELTCLILEAGSLPRTFTRHSDEIRAACSLVPEGRVGNVQIDCH